MHFASDGCSLISTSHVMLLYAETDNMTPYHTRAGEPGGFPTQVATYIIRSPPLISIEAPVMYCESVTRNRTSCATSSGVPSLEIGKLSS